jgi:hypothetical protein
MRLPNVGCPALCYRGKDKPSVMIYDADNFPILLKVEGRVKIFVKIVAASGLYPEHENGTPFALQTEVTMIFLKRVLYCVAAAELTK